MTTPLAVREAKLEREVGQLTRQYDRLTNRMREDGPESAYLASYLIEHKGLEHAVNRMRELVRRETKRINGWWA